MSHLSTTAKVELNIPISLAGPVMVSVHRGPVWPDVGAATRLCAPFHNALAVEGAGAVVHRVQIVVDEVLVLRPGVSQN